MLGKQTPSPVTVQSPQSALRKILGPCLLLIILVSLKPLWHHFISHEHFKALSDRFLLVPVWETALLLTFAWLLGRIFEIVLWQRIVEPRIGTKVPKLLKSITNGIIFFIVLVIVIAFIFNKSVTGILATTGIFGVVIGLGLRSPIENAFNGITLSMDRIIRIGDWVTIGTYVTVPSLVTDISYRHTSLLTQDNNVVVLPNNLISTSAITNYSRPNDYTFLSIFMNVVVTHFPADRIQRILETALRSCPYILREPKPNVFINNIADGAVEFELRGYIDFQQATRAQIKNEIYSNIIHYFDVVGIPIDVTLTKARIPMTMEKGRDEVTLVLEKLDLFSELTSEEIAKISKGATTHYVKANTVIFEEGDKGDSMYIIAEGLFKVIIKTGDGFLVVNRLTPGQYFGEMSLLIGEPRSATISASTDAMLIEINKETISTLLRDHPNLQEVFSKVIAERQVMNLQKEQAMREQQIEDTTKSYSQKFLNMMKKWFGH